MKKILSLALITLLFSCKNEVPKEQSLYPEAPISEEQTQITFGEELFNGKGNCFACHKPDQKIIGPSIQEIATIYKEKNADMVAFLQGKGEPIVDPDQYEVMKTNFAITKNLPEAELKALEAYFYSFAK